MLTALYYALMLFVGYVWYRYGQKLLRQGPRDDSGDYTKAPLGTFQLSGRGGDRVLSAL